MKTIITFVSAIFAFAAISTAQEPCKVLVTNLQGSYEGGCKKGLAHGKGTAKGVDTYKGSLKQGYPNGQGIYTWANGDTYDGEWKVGLREGVGKFRFTSNGRDSLLNGLWKQDKYTGPVPLPPKVTTKMNIVSVNFYRVGDGSQVSMAIYQGGNFNGSVQDFSMISTNGVEFKNGSYSGYDNIVFPFHCKVTYTTGNLMGTARFNCILEFDITEPGRWDVRIDN